MKFLKELLDLGIITQTKVKELEELRKEFKEKGYNNLYEIPPSEKKDRWIKLLNELGVETPQDPLEKAKPIKSKLEIENNNPTKTIKKP